jgi:hypothetical protein
MSVTTAIGIVIVVVLSVSVVIVGVMFWWAAREDGRDQRRIDELREQGREQNDDGAESPDD